MVNGYCYKSKLYLDLQLNQYFKQNSMKKITFSQQPTAKIKNGN